MSELELVISYLSISLNILSILFSCAIEYILHTSWKIIPNRQWLRIFLLINILCQFLAITYILLLIDPEHNVSNELFVIIADSLAFFNGFNLFAVTMLNISVLKTFSVLLDYLSEFRIMIWRLFNILLFIGLLWPPVVDLFYATNPLFNTIYSNFIIYSVLVVFYDNGQAIFLAFVVFRWSRVKARGNQKGLSKDFNKTISTILFLVLLDWVGVASVGIGYITSSTQMRVALAGVATAIGGFHLSGLTFVFRNLKGMVSSVARVSVQSGGRKKEVVKEVEGVEGEDGGIGQTPVGLSMIG